MIFSWDFFMVKQTQGIHDKDTYTDLHAKGYVKDDFDIVYNSFS